MAKKPIFFNIATFVFLMIALSVPLQIAYIYNFSVSFAYILDKITYLNWAIIFLGLINAYWAYEVDRKLQWTLPATLLLVGLNNWLVSQVGHDFSQEQTALATLAMVAFVGIFYLPRHYQLLTQPQLRWWKTKKRIPEKVKVQVQSDGSQSLFESFDLSETGMYILNNNQEIDFDLHKYVYLQFANGEQERIRCRAQVVRREDRDNQRYPFGYGLHFSEMDRNSKKILKNFINSINIGDRAPSMTLS